MAASTQPTSVPSKASSISLQSIIGIAVGVAVCAIVILILLAYLWHKRRSLERLRDNIVGKSITFSNPLFENAMPSPPRQSTDSDHGGYEEPYVRIQNPVFIEDEEGFA